MAEQETPPRPRRRWRRRLIVLAVVLVALVGAWVAFRWFTSSARLAGMVRQALVEQVGGEAQVAAVDFRLLAGTTIRQVELRETAGAKPWASVAAIHVAHRPLSLLRGVLDIQSVRVVRPRLVVNEASLARLERLGEEPGEAEGPSPATVTVEGGEVLLQRTRHTPRLEELALRGISVTLENPDRRGRLLHLQGEVHTPAGRVALEAHADTAAQTAHFVLASGALRLDKLPLDLLPEDVRTRRELRELRGHAAAEARARVQWDGARPALEATVQLWPREVAFASDACPLPIRELRGEVRARPGHVAALGLTARAGEAHVQVDELRLAFDPAGRLAQLLARGEVSSLRLDERVRSALPEAARKSVESLGVQDAAADAAFRLTQDGDGAPAVLLDLRVDAADLRPQAFPYPLPTLAGRVRYDSAAGLLRLDDVGGSDGRLALEADGAVDLGGSRAASSLRVQLSGLRLDERLRQALPKDAAAVWDDLGVQGGTVAAAGIVRRQADRPEPFLASATAAIEGLALAAEPRVERATGAVRYTAPAAPQEPHLVTAHLPRAHVANLPLRDIFAQVSVTPEQVDVAALEWAVCGGRAAARMQLQPGDPLRYAGQVDLAHVDVESLAAALGAKKNVPTGWLRGSVTFQGTGPALAGLDLAGQCKVDRGRLYELPLIATVLNVLSLQLPGRGTITDALVEFRIREGTLHLDHFLLTGHTAPLHVTGTIELKPATRFDQQAINLVFTLPREKQLLDKVPVIGWLKAQSVDRLTRYFLQARATGTLAKPEVKHVLKPIGEPVEAFWSVLRRVSANAAATLRPKQE